MNEHALAIGQNVDRFSGGGGGGGGGGVGAPQIIY
jgi:hypothetical protein